METKTLACQHRPKRIAMYVIYDKDGILDNYRKYYLKELRKEVDTIVGVVSGTLTPQSRRELEELTDDFFVRENVGLLAGSWFDGIAHIGWDVLDEYDELLMLNDSFFGPFYPLSEMMNAAEESDADFYGCMKNFEEPEYREMAGRKLKHGFFRGSICYFYIIKSRLLHSHEFKKYWSKMPEVKEDWDTYFFAEISFYDYVKDAGFKIDAYQGDALKGYFFDNLTHNMHLLVENERIPYARIRPFATDMKDQIFQIHYGKDPRQTLEYIDKHTSYDTNMIWDYMLRTKKLVDIVNQLQLEYVVSKDYVEVPLNEKLRLAAIVHIYYEDQVPVILKYCRNFPENTDFYLTTTSQEVKEAIENGMKDLPYRYELTVRPNVGVAMSSLWITYADVVTEGNYDYICYFHDKKSPYSHFAIQGQQFAERLYENLVGSRALIQNILMTFEQNPRMGIAGVPMVYHSDYFMVVLKGLELNRPGVMQLVKDLNLNVTVSKDCVDPSAYGDMFWFRPAALKKAISHGFTYDDFDIKYQKDGTILHAIERCYGYIAQDAGFYYADIIGSDDARTDLSNYSYMLNKVAQILLSRGVSFSNFYSMTQALSMALDARLGAQSQSMAAAPLQHSLVTRMLNAPFGVKEALAIWINKRLPFLFKKTAQKFPPQVRTIGVRDAFKIWRTKRLLRTR